MLDYHVHSTCSGDGHVSMADMCAKAVELGITEIAFTEHLDNNPADICYGTFDPDFYLAEIESVREKFGGQLMILTGVEFGEPHLYRDQLRELQDADWPDVILGSMHWIGDLIIAVDGFGDADMDELYCGYFDEVLKMVEAGGFDVLAHFDLVKRFGVKYAGPFRIEPFKDQIAVILETIIKQGIALEVNTSGLRQPCNEPFPSLETLKLYRDLGGKLVTIGSDSHRLEQLGFGLKDGLEMIRTVGFDSITLYRNRRPERYNI